MFFVALKRLWHAAGLTLLSIMAVALAVGVAVSIPVFAKAVSFCVLRQELDRIGSASKRPPFSMRIYVLPGGRYSLSLDRARTWQDHVTETIVSELGFPLISQNRHLETSGLVMRTRDQTTGYGPPYTPLIENTSLTILPGVESRLAIVDGKPMDQGTSTGQDLDIWIHHSIASQIGMNPGEAYEVYDLRREIALPVRIAGTWKAADPADTFWFQNPDLTLQRTLLVREADYRVLVEPVLEEQLGFASWYLILDDRSLTSENMQRVADGLKAAQRIIEQYIPGVRIDGSPLQALEESLERESDLTVLMFVFSVPVMSLIVYSVAGGAAIGIWASRLFIPFFQAADNNVLRPPTMIPFVAWQDIGQISGAFIAVLVMAQFVVIGAAARRGVFQALRMGDQE